MTMCIFSKRRFLLTCLVMVRILKAIIEGFHSAVIRVCDELVFALKGKETTTVNRAIAYAINYHGLSSKTLHASEFGSQNLNPAAADFQMSDFQSDQSVAFQPLSRDLDTASILDASHTSKNDIRERLTTVEEKSAPSKSDSSDPFKVPIHSTMDPISSSKATVDSILTQVDTALDEAPMTSQCTTVPIETVPKNKSSIQDATTSYEINISPAPTVNKLNSSDQESVSNIYKDDNSMNDTSDSHLSNVAKPILTQIKTKQSLHTATPHQRNMISKENDAIQSSTNQANICTQEHTIGRNIWSSNPSVAASFKDDIQCPKRSGQHKGYLSIKNENTEQAKITNIPHRVKTKSSCLNSGDEIESSTNQSDIGTRGHNIDRNMLITNPSVSENLKDDIQCPKRSVQDGDLYFTSKNTVKKKITNSPDQIKTNSTFPVLEDVTNPAVSSESEQIALTKDTKNLSYFDYLKQNIPIIIRIEGKIIFLCHKTFRNFSLPSIESTFVNREIVELIKISENVRKLPSQQIVLLYTNEIKTIYEYLQLEIELSLKLKNRANFSLCLKKLAGKLENARKLLFDVDEECIKLRLQMGNVQTSLKR